MAKKAKKRSKRRGLNNVLLAVCAVAVGGVVVAGVWLAVSGDSTPTRRALRQPTVVSDAQQVSVEVFDNDFAPRDLTVSKGATVVWAFTGDLPHNVTDDRGAFASDTQVDGEYTRKFEAAGIYYYYCTIHHSMQGTLTVRE